MKKRFKIYIEKLPCGAYLATSNDIQGLIAQGKIVGETLEIDRDIARKLLQAQSQDKQLDLRPNLDESYLYQY